MNRPAPLNHVGFTGRLAQFSVAHKWIVIGFWTALFLVGGFLAGSISDVLTSEGTISNNPESEQADTLLEERLRGPDAPEEFVIVSADEATVGDTAYEEFVSELVAEIRALDGTVASATSYLEAGEEGLVSADGTVTLLPVTLTGKVEKASDTVEPLVELIEEVEAPAGFEVLISGIGSVGHEFNSTSERDLVRGELMFGLPAAVIILIIVFGAVVAAGIPLAVALVSIVIAFGTAYLIGQAFELSFFVTNMITAIGLAVGIDYSLFIVQRYREERLRGYEKPDAIVKAGATASRAVLFSGGAVIIGLSGMLIVPSNIYRSLGIGAIAVAVFAVATALTLLPAILSLLGDSINRLKVPFRKQMSLQNETGGVWSAVARIVMRRPAVSLVVSVALLIAAAVPYLTITVGLAGVSTLPEDNDARRAFTILEREFSAGLSSPVEIVVDGDVSDGAVQSSIDELVAILGEDDLFGEATIETNEAGDLALVSVPLRVDPQSDAAHEAVERLRDEYGPEAFTGADARVLVTGLTAGELDFFEVVDTYTPIVFAMVLGLSFILLLIVFRSIVVPIKAIIMNLLSVGAAYGLLVLVFQHGVGNEIFGFQEVETIEAWLPLFLFAFMFGLSMDYHVFLLSRIRERFDMTLDNTGAVAFGIRSTASIITGAALIMVAVFAGFALGELVMLQQLGFSLGVAVLLDATVIRSVVVPSSMQLLGRTNWYLPSWLEWLPEIKIEGEVEPAGAPAGAE